MLAVARRELPHGIFMDGVAEELPFKDGQFQLVTCVTALHLVSDPHAVFAEIARVLTPGGRLVLATFQIPPGHPVVDRPYRTDHAAFETPALLEAIAGPFGFNVTRSEVGEYGGDTCLITELSL